VQSSSNASQCEDVYVYVWLCVPMCVCVRHKPRGGKSTAITRRPLQGHFPENKAYFPNGSNVKKDTEGRQTERVSLCVCAEVGLAGFLTKD